MQIGAVPALCFAAMSGSEEFRDRTKEVLHKLLAAPPLTRNRHEHVPLLLNKIGARKYRSLCGFFCFVCQTITLFHTVSLLSPPSLLSLHSVHFCSRVFPSTVSSYVAQGIFTRVVFLSCLPRRRRGVTTPIFTRLSLRDFHLSPILGKLVSLCLSFRFSLPRCERSLHKVAVPDQDNWFVDV